MRTGRARTWIESSGIQSGSLLPLNIPELDVSGTAIVTSVEECPSIASGDGSVVTARFLTREVHVIVRAEVLGPDGSIELVEGTTVHPIWSEDRQDFIPLAELLPGETLRAADGPAMVLSLVVLNKAVPVYNVEVHGEHVYQVGTFGIHVHNSTPCSPNVAAQVLNEAAPTVRSSLNRTLEATIGALKKLGTPKGTISPNRIAAEQLANEVKSFLGETGQIVEHFPGGGKLPHFHIEGMDWWHFWY